ncbi:prostaglandin D2 synthase b, tandem duplicate 1 [Acanthopagrus latus]|uniref:prostaglandin D2 synthase b, tandem duplicate 1 n=1 Tax=Acanthopagrus latus TaxID=8177 RepID=UPI00187CF371|nr:prostaglandin D2 synthase b, tandem duplicate 1 [Acanthopagrus latus]
MGSRPLQDIRSLHWPLPPHLVLILHFTAGEDPDNRDAMRNTLLSMLATLMCTLAASIDVTPMSGFDLEKAAGKWYMVGFATNAQWFVNHKAGMKTGTAMLVPTAGGDLDLSYANLNSDGTCWRMTHLAKKTETPGRFTFRSQVWNNENDMRIVDIVYDDYALVHTIKTKDGVSEVLNKLYSRSAEANPAMQLKFRQFSLETGILADNIVLLPQNAECPEV